MVYLNSMRIIYLNAWHAIVKEPLREFIKQEAGSADIYCFQEATQEVKELCQVELNDYVEVSSSKSTSEKDNFYQSIFFKKDISLISSGTLMTDDIDTGLAVYIEVEHENGAVYVCNFHGVAYPGDKLDNPGRIKQSSRLIEFFEDQHSAVVIGGDFNVELNTKSIDMFESNGYKNLIKDCSVDTTRNRLAWERYPNSKKMYSDYVFISQNLKYKSFVVPKIEVSDHLPLILEI